MAGMRLPMQILALIVGLSGAVVAFLLNTLYSAFHVIGRIAGITANQTHFVAGTMLCVAVSVGAFLVLVTPEISALILALAAVGFAFVLGWWAILPALFLLPAAWLAFNSRIERRATAS